MIKEIQETNEYQSEIIDQFKNEFKQITVSGDSIYIPDAAELPMELVPYGEPVQEVIEEELGTTVEGESVVVAGGNPEKEVKDTIYGMSKQNTTEGYNRLDLSKLSSATKNGITLTKNNDGTVVLNGTATGDANFDFYITDIEATTSDRLQIFNFGGSYTNTYVSIYMATDNTWNDFDMLSLETRNPTTMPLKAKTYTYARVKVNTGVVCNNLVIGFQVVSEANKDKPFEPYTNGASPNTEYEQDIEVITECSLVQRGKNRFNGVFRQGSYTDINLTNRIFSIQELELEINKTCTISTNLDTSIYRFAIAMSERKYPTSGGYYPFFDSGWKTQKTYSFTPTREGYFGIGISRIDNGAITLENIKDYYFMLEDGDTATDYEPYIEPIVKSINLNGNSLAKVGEIADLLNIGVDGSVSITKKNDKVTLDGVNVPFVQKSGDTANTIWMTTNIYQGVTVTGQMLSSHFIARGVYGFDREGIYLENNRIKCGFGLDTELTTLELANQWLVENNVDVLFKLLTPQTIDLPSIEPITLFEGTNVFELVTNLGTTMTLTYDYVTPSPSIDRPSEILTVQGDYDTINSDNFFDNVFRQGGYNNRVATQRVFSQNQFEVKKGQEYTVLTNLDLSIYNYVIALSNTKFPSSNLVSDSGWLSTNGYKFIAESDAYFGLGLRRKDEGDITPSDFENVYFEIVTKYNNLPLTLTNELLGEIVTLTEEEATNLGLDGAGKYRRTDYGRYVFKGVENFSLSSYSTNERICAYLNILTILVPGKIQCNMIKTGNYTNNLTDELITTTSNSFNIAVFTSRLTDNSIDGLNQFLKSLYDAGNPMEAIYELATPTYEKITDETELEQLSAHDKQIAFFGINNINTYPTNDLVKAPLKIHATYSKSNKLTI